MSIKIEEASNRLEDVKALFTEYVRSLDVDLSFQNFNEELSTLPGKYARPAGRLYTAYSDGKIAGCVVLRKYSEQTCEMKRLYVRALPAMKMQEHFTRSLICRKAHYNNPIKGKSYFCLPYRRVPGSQVFGVLANMEI